MSVMFIERWAISILLSRNLTTCTFSSSCCFAYTCIQLISSDLERGVTREDVHNSPEAPQASPHPVNWWRSNHITFDSDSWSTTTSNTTTKYTEPRPLRAETGIVIKANFFRVQPHQSPSLTSTDNISTTTYPIVMKTHRWKGLFIAQQIAKTATKKHLKYHGYMTKRWRSRVSGLSRQKLTALRL